MRAWRRHSPQCTSQFFKMPGGPRQDFLAENADLFYHSSVLVCCKAVLSLGQGMKLNSHSAVLGVERGPLISNPEACVNLKISVN